MHPTKFLALLFTCTLFVAASCEKEDPEPPNTPEVISVLSYTLTPEGGGDAVVFQFEDLDGDGGNAPTITNGTLTANTVYDGALTLFVEGEGGRESLNPEIEEEDEEHQFFFQTDAGVTVAYADMDADGNPIGLASKLTTTEAGTGTMTIILHHEPMKSAEGVASGDITNSEGSTDVEANFVLDVQ